MASMISSGWPAATASPSFTDRLTIVPCIGAGTGTVPSGASLDASCAAGCCRRLAERQHRQRIDRIDARASLPAAGRGAAAAWKYRPPSSLAAAAISFFACSSTKRVCTLSARTSLSASSARRKPMFEGAPSSRNDASARSARASAASKVGPLTITLASSESKFGLVR